MLEQYKALNEAINKLALHTIEQVQQVDGKYNYSFEIDGKAHTISLSERADDIAFIGTLIRGTMAIEVHGEAPEGFVL